MLKQLSDRQVDCVRISVMDPLMISAASGMKARIESLEMLANNVANSGTSGFKADREFYSTYISEQAHSAMELAAQAPVIDKRWVDFSQGTLTPTGNPLDLALFGQGFFALESPSGTLYTRSGHFRLGADGQIEAQDGNKLRIRTNDGRPIRLEPSKPIEIGADGSIRQDGLERGRILTFDLNNTDPVAKRGSTYFQWMADTAPKTAQPEIRQGTTEASNVPVAENAVRLVSIMRQFEMLQRAVALAGDMNRRAIEEVAKVG